MAGLMPKNGFVADPGFVSVAPGIGVNRCPPVSVCHHVSTIGQFPFPTTSLYQFHASGFIGSPTVPELLGTINYIFRHIRYLGPSAHG